MVIVPVVKNEHGEGPFTVMTSAGPVVPILQSEPEMQRFADLAHPLIPSGTELTALVVPSATLEDVREHFQFGDARPVLDDEPEYAELIISFAAFGASAADHDGER